jgi:hypothetical protein
MLGQELVRFRDGGAARPDVPSVALSRRKSA